MSYDLAAAPKARLRTAEVGLAFGAESLTVSKGGPTVTQATLTGASARPAEAQLSPHTATGTLATATAGPPLGRGGRAADPDVTPANSTQDTGGKPVAGLGPILAWALSRFNEGVEVCSVDQHAPQRRLPSNARPRPQGRHVHNGDQAPGGCRQRPSRSCSPDLPPRDLPCIIRRVARWAEFGPSTCARRPHCRARSTAEPKARRGAAASRGTR